MFDSYSGNSEFGAKVGNGSFIMKTEHLNTRFPGPSDYPATCMMQREAKKKVIIKHRTYIDSELT